MDTAEYNKIVDAQADGLYRFMLKLCADEHSASDLVQEAFEKLWLKRESVSLSKAKSYLFTIAYNTFLNQKKRAEKVEYKQHEDLGIQSFDESNSSDLKEVLDLALNKLPTIQKTVVLLRDYEGYDYQEIADICKLSLSQVKVYIFRARKFLKNELISVEAHL